MKQIYAFLFLFTRFSIPAFPIVSKTYDEYGPGNPRRDSMNNPSSSMIIGLLNFENANFAFFVSDYFQ